MQRDLSVSRSHPELPEPGFGISKRSVVLVLLSALVTIALALATKSFGYLVFLVIPAVVIVLGGLSKPDLSLAAFLFVTVTQFSEVGIAYYGLPSIAQPLAGVLIVIILVRMLLHGETPLQWAESVPLILLYITVLFSSLLYAKDFTLTVQSFIGLGKDILGGLIVILLVRRKETLRNAIWTIIVAGALMATVSVIQFITADFDNPFGGFGGWESQVSGETVRNRITGPYHNPNAYAQVMVVVVAFALSRLWYEKKPALRFFAGLTAGLCVLTVYFTYSRGGFLTLIGTLAILVMQGRPRLFPLAITVIIGFSLLQFLPVDYTSRLATLTEFSAGPGRQLTDPSFRGRLSENIAAWQMFLDHPLTGVGVGNYPAHYLDYSPSIGLDGRRVGRTAASLYMEILAEQGFIGIFIFSLLIYMVFWGLIKARIQFASLGMHDDERIVMSILAGLAGYLVAAAVKNSAYANVFWVLIGLAVSAAQVAFSAVRQRARENSF